MEQSGHKTHPTLFESSPWRFVDVSAADILAAVVCRPEDQALYLRTDKAGKNRQE